jgi:hypothetical protein
MEDGGRHIHRDRSPVAREQKENIHRRLSSGAREWLLAGEAGRDFYAKRSSIRRGLIRRSN